MCLFVYFIIKRSGKSGDKKLRKIEKGKTRVPAAFNGYNYATYERQDKQGNPLKLYDVPGKSEGGGRMLCHSAYVADMIDRRAGGIRVGESALRCAHEIFIEKKLFELSLSVKLTAVSDDRTTNCRIHLIIKTCSSN